jgi:hypothetical protein
MTPDEGLEPSTSGADEENFHNHIVIAIGSVACVVFLLSRK